jgi:CubicO group peptidase (beta-lactamase class C family)
MTQTSTLRGGKPEDVGMDPARIELIRERARGWVANGDTPSLVLLVARKGVIVLEEAYGILRPSDDAPLQTDSIFPVASTTKPITAAAVMCLVEDGLLSLKHPITDYIPEITTPGADEALIADLLTHTSGYDDMDVYAHAARSLHERRPISEPAPGQHPITNSLIRHAADAPLAKAPGVAMAYSNFGFELLGDIVRRVSGSPFRQFVASRIFEPLGMADSHFVVPANALPRRVRRRPDYPMLKNPFIPSVDTEAMDGWESGGAGVKSTAKDLARFGQMLLNGGVYGEKRVLSRASVGAMTVPQLPPGIPSYFSIADAKTGSRFEYPIRGGSYGYGLFISTRDDRTTYMNGSLASPRTYSHEGYGSCSLWVDPDAELVGVYLSVIPKLRSNGMYFWRYDYFQDMVHAAIVD